MDLLGHERQLAELRRDMETGNVAHAYLFVGPPHVGKFTVAKEFAKELLLLDVPEAERERMAEQISRLLHPDLFVLDALWVEDRLEDWNEIAKRSNVPQEHRKKAGAKTDRIGIDDIRAIQERIMDTATGRHRVVCIRDASRMDDPPANALLKILEEPPAGRVFVLTAPSVAAVLPTVVSRCRLVQFAPLGRAELQPLLRGIPEDDAQFLQHVAQGAPGTVRRLLGDPETLRKEKQLHAQANAFWRSRRLAERLRLLAPLRERGEESERFLLHLALALREQRPLPLAGERALRRLSAGLRTNVHRPLLAAAFALRATSTESA